MNMDSVTLSIAVGIIAIIHWSLDIFSPTKPLIKNSIKILSLLIVFSSFYSSFLAYSEKKESDREDLIKKIRILTLENDNLKLNSKILNLATDLEEEKNKLKSIAVHVKVKLSGEWSAEEAPFSSYSIHRPIHDTPILLLLPRHGVNRASLTFYPTQPYTFFDNEQGSVVFDATLSLRGDADILSAKKSDIFNFDRYHFAIPLINWQRFPKPLVVNSIRLEMRINDTDLYILEKKYSHVVSPHPEPITKDNSLGFYLHQIVNFKRADFKYTLLKK